MLKVLVTQKQKDLFFLRTHKQIGETDISLTAIQWGPVFISGMSKIRQKYRGQPLSWGEVRQFSQHRCQMFGTWKDK